MSLDPPRRTLPPHTALRAFEAAARHQSFAAAAQELCVTPAAVAQQIKSLEDWLGGPLFERRARGVVLTPRAQRAWPALAQALDQLGLAVQTLRTEVNTRELQLVALPAVAQLWLSPRLPALRRAYPGLQVSVTAMEQPPNFKREPYDLGLFYGQAPSPDVTPDVTRDVTPLANDRLVPVCSPALGRALRRMPPAALQGHTLLHDAVWRHDWAAWFAGMGVSGIDTDSGPRFSLFSLAVQAAQDGEGVLVARQRLVAPLLARRRLVAPWPDGVPLVDTLNLHLPAHRQGHALSQSVAQWLATAVDAPAGR